MNPTGNDCNIEEIKTKVKNKRSSMIYLVSLLSVTLLFLVIGTIAADHLWAIYEYLWLEPNLATYLIPISIIFVVYVLIKNRGTRKSGIKVFSWLQWLIISLILVIDIVMGSIVMFSHQVSTLGPITKVQDGNKYYVCLSPGPEFPCSKQVYTNLSEDMMYNVLYRQLLPDYSILIKIDPAYKIRK